ncbi:hypothetical protein CLV56_2328 [Mumia flava]|uniref:Uncharacterized protein n=1 Tax=Mumia flava TaxID=1348852 RepID=A0A0B2BVR2_9ACTN|nr:hypothetical protein CLV56_2328 [Mumia flava]
MLALFSGIGGVLLLAKSVPTGIVTSGGAPGAAALASGAVPGSASLEVRGGTTYTVWSTGDAADGLGWVAQDAIAVRCDDGEEPPVSSVMVAGRTTSGMFSAASVIDFEPVSDGTCEVTVGGNAFESASGFVVTEGHQSGSIFGSFFAYVGGAAVAIIAAIGAGLLGGALLVAGIVWRIATPRP